MAFKETRYRRRGGPDEEAVELRFQKKNCLTQLMMRKRGSRAWINALSNEIFAAIIILKTF